MLGVEPLHNNQTAVSWDAADLVHLTVCRCFASYLNAGSPALSFQSKFARLIGSGRHGCASSVRCVSLCFLITLFCVEYRIWSTGVKMFFLEKIKIKGKSYRVLELLNCFVEYCSKRSSHPLVMSEHAPWEQMYGPHLQAPPEFLLSDASFDAGFDLCRKLRTLSLSRRKIADFCVYQPAASFLFTLSCASASNVSAT